MSSLQNDVYESIVGSVKILSLCSVLQEGVAEVVDCCGRSRPEEASNMRRSRGVSEMLLYDVPDDGGEELIANFRVCNNNDGLLMSRFLIRKQQGPKLHQKLL